MPFLATSGGHAGRFGKSLRTTKWLEPGSYAMNFRAFLPWPLDNTGCLKGRDPEYDNILWAMSQLDLSPIFTVTLFLLVLDRWLVSLAEPGTKCP